MLYHEQGGDMYLYFWVEVEKFAGGCRWRGDRHGANLAEEEPARSRRAGRRSNWPYDWQDPEPAAAGVRTSLFFF